MTVYVVRRLLRGMRHVIEALEGSEEELEQVLDRRALAEMSDDEEVTPACRRNL